MSSSEIMRMGNDDDDDDAPPPPANASSPEEGEGDGDGDDYNNNNNNNNNNNQNINNINNDDDLEEDNTAMDTTTNNNNNAANASSDGDDDDGNDDDGNDGNSNIINSSNNDNHNADGGDGDDGNDNDGSKNNDDGDGGDNDNENINADASVTATNDDDDDDNDGKCNENDGNTTTMLADDDDDDDGNDNNNDDDDDNIDNPTNTVTNSNITENNDERDESNSNNKNKSRRSSKSNNNNRKDKIIIKNELNKRRKFHCIRCCGSLQGSAVFTNWDDCQMMISSSKHNNDDSNNKEEEGDDGDGDGDNDDSERPSSSSQQRKKPSKKKYEYKSFDDWDDAYQFLYPRKKKRSSSSSSPGTSSNNNKKQASYNTTTRSSSSKANTTNAITSTGRSSSSNSRSNSNNNRKRSIDQVYTRRKDDEEEEEEEEEEDPTSNYAKAYPPEGPIIDPDSIELPIMIQGAQGQTPKQELNDWHLGRKLSFFNKNFDERMTEMSQYLDEFDGNFFVGRRNKNNKNHPQYKPLLNWIDNTLRPQLKVYTTLKETRGTVPVDILPKHHGYSRFILFMKRSHIERMKGVGIYDSLMMEAKERRAMVKAKVQESKEPQVWDSMYEDLQKFKDRWGHVIVRREECIKDKQPGHSKLVNWVDRQRQEYRKLQQGDPESTMTNDRIVKLSELGVVLDSKPMQSFDDRAREWLIYKATHNGEDPPPSKTKNNGLHLWIVKTRQKYAKLQAGEKTTLTQEQADQLSSWGFNFEIKKPRASSNNGTGQQPKRSWEDRLQDYIDFKAEYGTAWITKNSCALGQWCADQRKNYNVYKANLKNNGGNESSSTTTKGPMTAEKIAKLEAAGFPWEKPGDNDIVFDSRQAKRQKLQQDRQRHLMEIEAMEPSLRQEAATDIISTRPRNPESTIAPAATTRDGENVDTTNNTTTNDETMDQQQHQNNDNNHNNDNSNDNTAAPAVTILYPPPPPPTHPPMGGVHPHHHHPQYHPHPHAPPMHPHPPPLPPPYQQQQDPYHMHHHQNGGGDGGADSNNGGQQGQAQDQQQQQYGNNNNGDGGQEQQQQQQQQQFPRFGKYPWGFGSM